MTTKELAADVLNYFFPFSPIAEAEITDGLAQLAAEILHDAYKATDTLDLVPRPPSFLPGPSWLAMQIVGAIWRTNRNKGIYEMVINVLRAKYRTRYELEKLGV